jgi:hypothetical protein
MTAIQTPAGFQSAVPWLNVTFYGADPANVRDSTTPIQNALNAALAAGGGVVYFPAGTYKTSAALTLKTGVTLQGAGENATTIKQNTAGATHGLTGVDLSYVSVRDLTLSGPNSGSGNGINLTRSVNPNIPYCSFSNLQIATFGNAGFFSDTMIASTLSAVQARSNGGDGFQFNSTTGNTTSVALAGCFANANSGSGYELDSCVYCVLNGCASDNNLGGGYALFGAQSCTLNACGSEANTGNNVLLSGGIGNTVNGLWVNVNSGVGVSLASGETFATLNGCVENSVSGSPTAFIKTVAGTSCVITNDKHATANSFAAGTAFEIVATGGTAH